jgi:Fanconi anemia group M protein
MGATVIVDRRERNTELTGALEANGIEMSFKTLPVGDYILSDRVCVERKTVSDFENSMMSGRLFEQVERMKRSYGTPFLLLEGDRDYFRLKSRVINGAIAALYIDYGIEVILSHSAEDTAEIMASMARHEQEENRREPSLKGAARARSSRQFQEYMIGNLPGIGPKLSRALLIHFRSVRSIADASAEELMEVDKIGKKKAEMIYKTLNLEYKDEE